MIKKKTNPTLMESGVSDHRYRAIFENAGTAMLIIDEDETISLANREAERLLGVAGEELQAKKLSADFAAAADAERVRRYLELLLGDPESAVKCFEFRMYNGHKPRRDLLAMIDVIPGTRETVMSLLDITNRKRMEEMLRSVSLYDDLTGLHNRRGFLILASQQLKVAARTTCGAVLIYVDIDSMKWINDNLGHLAGDRALRAAAHVFNLTFRESDVTARIGGDEFVALALENAGFDAGSLIARLQENVAGYNSESADPFNLSMSLGLARYDPEKPVSIDGLIGQADASMYEQKHKHKEGPDV